MHAVCFLLTYLNTRCLFLYSAGGGELVEIALGILISKHEAAWSPVTNSPVRKPILVIAPRLNNAADAKAWSTDDFGVFGFFE